MIAKRPRVARELAASLRDNDGCELTLTGRLQRFVYRVTG